MRVRDLFIVLMVALFASTLFAQETTGKLQGRAIDAQGLPVPGATVTATGPQGDKSNDRCRWTFYHPVPDMVSTSSARSCRDSKPTSSVASQSVSARPLTCR